MKVGDTVVDIQEGKNAGAWSIGILTSSNLLGLTQAEYEAMAPDELEQRKQAAAERYLEAVSYTHLFTVHILGIRDRNEQCEKS